MTKNEFSEFLNDKISNYAKNIISKGASNVRSAVGELDVYTSVLQVLNHKNEQGREIASLRSLGVCDAINDILVKLDSTKEYTKFWQFKE